MTNRQRVYIVISNMKPKKKRQGEMHGLSRHPLYGRFLMARYHCTNKNSRTYRTYKGRWGNDSVVELVKHYKKAYEQKVKKNKKARWAISRIDLHGKFEIGNIEIVSVAELGRKRIQVFGNPAHSKEGLEKIRGAAKHKRRAVEAFINGKWKRYPSATVAGKQFGTHRSNVSYHCRFKGTRGVKDKNGNLIQVRYTK